jgi:hypothetical protein
MDYNLKVLKEVVSMIQIVSASKDKGLIHIFDKKSPLSEFMETTFEDSRIIIDTLNVLLTELIKKKKILSEGLNI